MRIDTYVHTSTERDAGHHINNMEASCGQRCIAAAINGRLLRVERLREL